MAFSITCSCCGRQFVDIDNAYIGRQARCKCDEVVLLDPIWKQPHNDANSPSKSTIAPASPPANRASQKKKDPPEQPQRQAGNASSAADRESTTGQQQPLWPAAIDSSNNQPESPATPPSFDSFDIDDILDGSFDQSPLIPTRTVAAEPKQSTATPSADPSPSEPSQTSTIGVSSIATLIGGASGLAAALILLVTRFNDLGGTPLGWTGQAFFGAYTGSYGSGEISDRSVSLFIGSGWVLLLLAVLLGVASLLLATRGAAYLAVRQSFFAWSRPAVATLSVICLFALMGLLFVQSVHHSELLHGLIDFAGEPLEGLIVDRETAEPFKEIRQQYQSENIDFMIGVSSFAVLPLLAFFGAVTSLFFDNN